MSGVFGRTMDVVLVVDDEDLFLRTVLDGVGGSANGLVVLSARNGREALEVLASRPVDLVVTDLKMPVMDGIELLAEMSRSYPAIPVIVMTAFGTADIERRLLDGGVHAVLDKPLTVDVLLRKIRETLEGAAAGRVEGITVPTFLQMIALEKKTCTLRIRSGAQVGEVCMHQGQLSRASCGALRGAEAAMAIACWGNAAIEIVAARAPAPNGDAPMALESILLEAVRRQDESMKGGGKAGPGPERRPRTQPAATGGHHVGQRTERKMAVQDVLKELTSVDGFGGAAVFTPSGESLAAVAGDMRNINEMGILANNVLMNAQKASLEMGTGRGQQVHVHADKAHILVRCLNEGTDPLKSQPGKAHIHMMVVLKDDSAIGLAKLRMSSVIEKLADSFRM